MKPYRLENGHIIGSLFCAQISICETERNLYGAQKWHASEAFDIGTKTRANYSRLIRSETLIPHQLDQRRILSRINSRTTVTHGSQCDENITLGPTYNEFGYNEHPIITNRFLCINTIDCNV